jgi:hypothetical protein
MMYRKIVVLMVLGLAALTYGAEIKAIVELDTSAVPEQAEWGQKAKAIVEEWYPRMVNLIPTQGFEPPTEIKITLRKSDRGIADAAGPHIRISSGWIEKHPEDIGLVVHELVHIIQNYGRTQQGWLTEGIADYLRWAIYEGKPLTWFHVPQEADGYKQSYRVTAGFLFWLESDMAPGIVNRLNTALRKKQYSDEIFEKASGLSLDALWAKYQEFRGVQKKDQ